MGKTRRCEKVLEECERRSHLQRCNRRELRNELKREKVQWLGTIDWEELDR